jgi:hypothetical protein
MYCLMLPGRPCDRNGNYLEPGTPPPPFDNPAPTDWSPFSSRIEFETAEFLYKRNQMSAGDIDTLLELWAATLIDAGAAPPFSGHRELYKTIDDAKVGEVPWESFHVCYEGDVPGAASEPPSWMISDFEVWYRNPHDVVKNMLANRDFDNEMDAAPYRDYDTEGSRQYQHFMSGDWAWRQAVAT